MNRLIYGAILKQESTEIPSSLERNIELFDNLLAEKFSNELDRAFAKLTSVRSAEARAPNQQPCFVSAIRIPSQDAEEQETLDEADVIETIYNRSRSLSNFAAALLMHFFKQHELIRNVSVKGMIRGRGGAKEPLDARRVDQIRAQVLARLKPDQSREETWKKCIAAINAKLYQIRKTTRTN